MASFAMPHRSLHRTVPGGGATLVATMGNGMPASLRNVFPRTTPSSGWTSLTQHELPMAAPLGHGGGGSRLERHWLLPKCGSIGEPLSGWLREHKTPEIPLTHLMDRRLVRTGDPSWLHAPARRCRGVNDGATRADGERAVPLAEDYEAGRQGASWSLGCTPGSTAPSHRLATPLSKSIDSLRIPGPG